MGSQITVSHPNTNYSLHSVIKSLPPDVSPALFLQLAKHCRPGARQINSADRAKLINVARQFQRLSVAEQTVLLSKASGHGNRPKTEEGSTILDPQEREAWIKECVSDAYSWVRDLRRLGVGSAASYIFAGRRSAPHPPKDWADEVLQRHYCEELTVQDSVVKYVGELDNAFLQLPDRRWYIKYRGEEVPPLADSFGGFHCIHNLIKNNHLASIVVRKKGEGPACIFMPPGSALSDELQRRNLSQILEKNELEPCNLKGFSAMRGNQAQEGGRNPYKLTQGRSNPEAKQILRAIQEIASHNSRVADVLNSAISADSVGVWSFNNPGRHTWVTEIGQLFYDATMERTQSGWIIQTPLSGEPIQIRAHLKGMEYLARMLQLTGVAVPSGLLANATLVHALTDYPPYRNLFKPAHQQLIRIDRFEFADGTRALVEAVNSARGRNFKYYEVTHVIPKESPLARYIPTGLVGLTPEGLSGVLYLLQKSLAAATIEGAEKSELIMLVKDIGRAVKYVARYEGLAAQIEAESNAAADRVAKAISCAADYFWKIGESSLGKYFETHIKTGKWEVRGLPPNFPDVVDLARDHMYMKLRRLARHEAGVPLGKHRQG